MADEMKFTFEISLSVLNHLGRNLYRSFITILGEAVSNSWDADADNVWIYINRDENYLIIKDDGIGMTADDFQNKFLKIGYTKRKYGETKSAKGRPLFSPCIHWRISNVCHCYLFLLSSFSAGILKKYHLPNIL
jgi:hypothetical protein